jgi:hypothetical protein
VVNGFSDTVVAVFGPDIGLRSRPLVGMGELPYGVPVEIEAEVHIS